jgi:hypothetical protein
MTKCISHSYDSQLIIYGDNIFMYSCSRTDLILHSEAMLETIWHACLSMSGEKYSFRVEETCLVCSRVIAEGVDIE